MGRSFDWKSMRFTWVGEQQMSDNGLELRSVVAQDKHGNFRAGTRYGPKGCAMPELGHQEFWLTDGFKDSRQAIAAAKTDTAQTVDGCNEKHRSDLLMAKAGSREPSKAPEKSRQSTGIDR
jgi:hypothetical protein